jgi:hypothetical protein
MKYLMGYIFFSADLKTYLCAVAPKLKPKVKRTVDAGQGKNIR